MLVTQLALVGICIGTSYSTSVTVYAALRLVTALFQTTGYIAAFVFGKNFNFNRNFPHLLKQQLSR